MFTPIIPSTGLTGWRFLQRTYDSQFAAFNQSSQLARAAEYFEEKISSVTTAEELVADRRLREVALGAFGLQDDIDNRFFIKKVLEEGTTNEDSLANRFSDSRYKDFSAAFGLGPGEQLKLQDTGFAQDIIAKYRANSFEIATGSQDDSMRVALFAQREIPALATDDTSNDAKWFGIMGQPPLRAVFEKALNLPSSFGQIDIDQQLVVFKERSRAVFGTDEVSQFAGDEAVQDLVTKYIVRSQLDSFNANTSSASIALTLLQS
ncbi:MULTISPECIES: DUF1217 domain-containing protein [Roseobacter]|uniref:Flagellar protein n=1 Tax=Roseobacter litoralis (strain ATCC 49566 / DSM 6996 / JCM 21268 / NBRC 15278 / OCh 149) TaxID=391595 RepID=F7ZIC0_ROSLO|nr:MULTISPECIES: DUF1217 domain-containing protein [Roseobacter]AEI96256.1 hypothetical protein DUF1217 [Roseobacter litoralis Och 149]GIT86495.1 flagellar protein [Roseobacter sp. OBYS 0001]